MHHPTQVTIRTVSISGLVEYFYNPDNYAWTTLVVASISLMITVASLVIKPIYHCVRGWRQTKLIRKIVQNGRNRVLADYPDKDRPICDDIDIRRYYLFMKMTSTLKAALEYKSSDLPFDRKNDIRYICTDVRKFVETAWNQSVGPLPKTYYEANIFDKLKEIKWLKL